MDNEIKFRSKPETYDLLMQKADIFNDAYSLKNIDSLLYLSFSNGFKFLRLEGKILLFVVNEVNEIYEIQKMQTDIVNTSDNEKILILTLFESDDNFNSFVNTTVLSATVISDDFDSYSPFYLQRLTDLMSDIKKDLINKIDYENKNQNIEIKQKTVRDSVEEFSTKHANEYMECLRKSSSKCAFILGNGVSIPLGADPWDKLVFNLVDYLTPFYIRNVNQIVNELSKSNYLVSSFVKWKFQDMNLKDVYISGLRYCVYRKFNKSMLKDNTLLKAVSLAKIKYADLPILTYNYDTFLEQQINELDQSTKTKPYSGKKYKKNYKNRIIHLHGTIRPESKIIDSNLVLTDDDYFGTYLSGSDNWAFKSQFETLKNKHCLFIGSSMSDLFQLSIIDRAKKTCGNEWCCYALMCVNEVGDDETINLVRFYLQKGIKVILTDNFGKIIDKLNGITGCSFERPSNEYEK